MSILRFFGRNTSSTMSRSRRSKMMTIQVLAFIAACVCLQILFPLSCYAQTCSPSCGPNEMCVSDNGTDVCTCKEDYYSDETTCSACNCVTGATCDQSGVCTCGLSICDKDELTVSLTSSASGTVIDTSTLQESVTLTCTINLPDDDVTVKIKYPDNNELTLTGSNGVYSKILIDVHPADSGTYRCEVTTMINGSDSTKDAEITLTVECANDFSGASCDMRCNCITGSNCNPVTGSCDCTTPPLNGAVCDKDELTVSLTSSASGTVIDTVIDTSTEQETVTLTCTINLPDDDVTVKIKDPDNSELTLTGSNRVYSKILSDVHPADSGTYRCEVTTMINGSDSTKDAEITLTVECYNDFYGASCDMRCNCIAGHNCNQGTGICDCTTPPFTDAVCDKDNLLVSMSPQNPVTDGADSQEQVTLTCTVNLPASDVMVKITKDQSEAALALTTAKDGMYTVLLNDVHPGDSGIYRCKTTLMIDGMETTEYHDVTLTVECSADFYSASCNMKCNCVTDAVCSQVLGVCSCTPAFSGAVCDKDVFDVLSVTSSPLSPVPDTSSMDDVTIQCRVNLPMDEIHSSGVGLMFPDSTGPHAMTFTSDGTYVITLQDVHSSDSGDYVCQAMPRGLNTLKTKSFTLEINDVDECLNIPPNVHNCDSNAACSNFDGGFDCQCNDGYQGDGHTGGSNTGCTACVNFYGFNCSMDCTCVLPIDSGYSDVTCNNVDGMCTCNRMEFTGKECDKTKIQVELSSDPEEILDTSGIENVTLKCMVNLHSRDLSLPVTIAYLPNGSSQVATMKTEGLFEVSIIDVTSSNNGNYTCNAMANGVTASASDLIVLNVVVQGGIVSVSDPVKAKLGETVQIYCKFYVRSDSTITWYFGASSDPIVNNAQYSISEEDTGDLARTSFLNISNIVRSDGGLYRCEVINTDSTSHTLDATVTVIERPEIGNVALVTLSHDRLNLSWDLTFAGNLPLQDCSVEHREVGSLGYNVGNTNSDMLSHVVMGLKPFTQYYIQVQCQNEVGMSDVISGGPQLTFQFNPSEPTNIQSTDIQPDSFIITWSQPIQPNGPIAFYRVQISRDNDMEIQEYNTTSQMQLVDKRSPYTEYTVIVTAFNRQFDKNLEGTPSEMKEVWTAQDVPSPPLNVHSENDEDSCVISWDRPQNENGIIQSYTVHYIAFPRVESGRATNSDESGSRIVNGNMQRYSLAKSGLAAYSDFEIKVSAKTEAPGSGEKSGEANGTCITSGAAPLAPARPVLSDNLLDSVTASSFKIVIKPASQRTGPISCSELTLVQLNRNERIDGKDPDILYHPDLLGTYQQAQESMSTPYVAMVFTGNEITNSMEVEIGVGGKTSCGGIDNTSSRKRRQSKREHVGDNGALRPNTRYTAFLRAYSELEDGMEVYSTSPLMQSIQTGEAPPSNVATIAVIVILSTLLIALAAGIIIFVSRSKVNRESRNTQDTRAVGATVEMNPTDYEQATDTKYQAEAVVYEDVGLPSWAVRWQILWSNLDVDDKILGRGNFGEVRSGTVNQGGQRTKCAIKILKGQASPTDRQDFLEEFRTMTTIGYHPNVVSLIGACQHEEVMYVALEYLPHGDLRNHLRSSRPDSDSEPSLTSEQLIKFALDVAMGMEHLASSAVIHRDLAARNILLGRGLVAKVSDFGLSRGEDIYVQTSMRRVPTRWLSIESILHKTYTTKSDVWSFGILLWEIATLGGTPYPSIRTKDLASQLTDGYRMSKPPNCDEKIYTLMIRCWGEKPSKRPSFSDLVTVLSGMNENQINQTYMAFKRPHYENFSIIRPELDDN